VAVGASDGNVVGEEEGNKLGWLVGMDVAVG
jgi:hypothetical protein